MHDLSVTFGSRGKLRSALIAALLVAHFCAVEAAPRAGKASYDLCQACHGVNGQGTRELGAPRLAGLDAEYVVRQLADFRAGRRGSDPSDVPGKQMAEMAMTLSDQQAIEKVAAYVAGLNAPLDAPSVAGDPTAGKASFATCAACHGNNAEGNPALQAPRLAGASDWYLLRQLQEFKTGRRGGGAPSSPGARMQAIMVTLADEAALRNVVAYIAQLPAPAAVTHSARAVGAAEFTLRTECPASFDKASDGTCHLVSLYDFYTMDPGQGGMRAPLPPLRATFTAEQADLGRYLFFDPLLSRDHTLSCAHCHHPAYGFADGRARSSGRGGVGVGPKRSEGVALRRSAPTLWNVGFLERLFWDGRAESLQAQATGPLFAPDEMANDASALERELSSNRVYRGLFATAFKRSSEQPIRVEEVLDALAAFESTLISLNSRYDRYAHGDSQALSAPEIRGLNVFRGFIGRCSQCHIPPLFSSSDVAVVGAPPVEGTPYDVGAGEQNAALIGAFKIPTLRNVGCTAPYFQAGQFQTLEDVVRFYNAERGHALPAGLQLKIHWHVHMKQPELSEEDVVAVAAFLRTLTDETLSPAIPAAVPSGLPTVLNMPPQCKQG